MGVRGLNHKMAEASKFQNKGRGSNVFNPVTGQQETEMHSRSISPEEEGTSRLKQHQGQSSRHRGAEGNFEVSYNDPRAEQGLSALPNQALNLSFDPPTHMSKIRVHDNVNQTLNLDSANENPVGGTFYSRANGSIGIDSQGDQSNAHGTNVKMESDRGIHTQNARSSNIYADFA